MRAEHDHEVWPGTGRFLRIAMYPMTVREHVGDARAKSFFDQLAEGDPCVFRLPPRTCAVTWSDAVMRDGNLLGRMLETFVAAQLRPETTVAECEPRLYHLRTEAGRHEVDVVAGLGAGRIIGIEIKATAAPTIEDAKHLRWLRTELGDRFVSGVVLRTGPRLSELADGSLNAPMSSGAERSGGIA